MLLAGLGEMPWIGEVVLNPLIAFRSKSAVVTAAMPIARDRPIDLDLQDSCKKAEMRTRMPCDAITYKRSVMFNGYEQWKQDVQRCTSYRVTNQGGTAFGRCMKKTCPYNKRLVIHRSLQWLAETFPALKRRMSGLTTRWAATTGAPRRAGDGIFVASSARRYSLTQNAAQKR